MSAISVNLSHHVLKGISSARVRNLAQASSMMALGTSKGMLDEYAAIGSINFGNMAQNITISFASVWLGGMAGNKVVSMIQSGGVSVSNAVAAAIRSVVPVKRGIGGAQNELEFLKNDVQIIDSISSTTVPGVSQIEYNMPKLDGSTYPATLIPVEYGTAVYKKTVYDPYIIGDGEFIKRGLEAAN